MRQPVGVLLAAGRGRRMGTLKQLLPWSEAGGAKPLVAAAFDALAPFCEGMIVVVGAEAERVLEALHPRRFIAARADPDAEMVESVRAGLGAAMREFPDFDVLLHPADQPVIRHETVTQITAAAGAAHRPNRRPCAVMPERLGKGGHPVFIPTTLFSDILRWRGAGGLRAYWETHPAQVVRVPVADAAILLDLDTPQDVKDATEPVSGALRRVSP